MLAAMSNATSLEAVTGTDAVNGEPQAAPAIDAIHQGDCVELLAQLPAESIDLAFADPPYNIGFKYDEYEDNHADEDYLLWCESWIEQLHRVVKPTGAFWLAIGDEYAAELKVAAKRIGFTARNWIVWYYTFGQNCTRKFNRSHAHLFHFVKDEELHTFNAADPAIRVPSARALVYGDRRANPTGRLPDDTWILRPQDLREEEAAFHPQDNTWYFSRVAGTFKERQGFHGCQMPEQLLGRIVRASSNEGDTVLDPFAGSGTTLAVAKKLGRHWLGFELSTDYVKYATERIEGVDSGDDLHGPADPVRSAPTTAKGRRLKGHPMADAANGKAEGGRGKAEPAENPVSTPPSTASLRDLTEQALVDAFHAAADGVSLDWLLCRPDLQAKFAAECEKSGLLGGPYDWNRLLLKLRKSGKLGGGDDKKNATKTAVSDPEAYAFAAEIAWARARAKHRELSLDDLLCDPEKLTTFDKAAAKAARGFETHEPRWAALRLRKAAKKLKAEAVQYEFVVAKLVNQLATGRRKKLTLRAAQTLREQPGVYVLAGAAKPETGEAGYVGEAADLGERLASHLVSPPLRGDLWYAAVTDESLPSDAYRHALRWNLVHRLQPTLSIDLLADGATF